MNRLLYATLFLLAAALPAARPACGADAAELAAMLDSPEPARRLYAVRTLAHEHLGGGLEYFLRAAGDEDELVRERAVQALAAHGGMEAAEAIGAALDDPAPFVRWRAVQGLDRLGVYNRLDRLGELVLDEYWRVQVCALRLLGKTATERMRLSGGERGPATVPEPIRSYIIAGIQQQDERVRLAAARALAVNRDPAAFDPLAGLLEEGSLFTREQAAMGFADLDDPRAAGILLEAVTAPENEVSEEGRDWARWGAVKALVEITGVDFGLDAARWRQWIDENL